jgi:hypothetical protein
MPEYVINIYMKAWSKWLSNQQATKILHLQTAIHMYVSRYKDMLRQKWRNRHTWRNRWRESYKQMHTVRHNKSDTISEGGAHTDTCINTHREIDTITWTEKQTDT